MHNRVQYLKLMVLKLWYRIKYQEQFVKLLINYLMKNLIIWANYLINM